MPVTAYWKADGTQEIVEWKGHDMAVASRDKDVLRYLRALGMPDNCLKYVIIATHNEALVAEATFYVTPDFGEQITKRFHLEEIPEEAPPSPDDLKGPLR